MQQALVAIAAGAVTQLVLFAFTFGRVIERQREHGKQLEDHETRLRSGGL